MDKRGKKIIKGAVEGRIPVLLHEARASFDSRPDRAERYIRLLWKIVQKYKVRLTKPQKLSFCRKCFCLWIPGRTVGISFEPKNKIIQYACRKCGAVRRLKYQNPNSNKK